MMPGMNSTNWNFSKNGLSSGSALILAVVLTSMLAIVGVLFVMMARVDKVATSAIVENRELHLAIETVIARISQRLVSDIPGVAGQEYYDYPDPCNTWLASLEPYQESLGVYKWRQISDVNNQLGLWARDLPAVIVPDYQDPCDVSNVVGLFADADGDGVADSRWVIIRDMTSSKGEPIFAAIRIVDNEAMLNVNTGFKFDPNVVDANRIDGSSQLQINLMALSWRPGFTVYNLLDEMDLLLARANYGVGVVDPCDLRAYERDVIWRYVQPNGPYTPFDVSDELEMRYRYLLNHEDIRTRIEDGTNLWTWSFNSPSELNTPVERGGGKNVDDWFYRAQHDVLGPNDVYSYRHLATTYNMDRIIDPNGDRMININRETSAPRIYDKLLRSIYPVIASPLIHQRFAQLAVNMVDFADEDDNNLDGLLDVNSVTTLVDTTGITHYGLEAQPFITEIAWKIGPSPAVNPNYYALELYNPFNKVIDLNDFALELVNRNDPAERYYITFPENLDGTPIVFINANSYCVIENVAGAFSIYSFLDPNTATTIRVDPRLRFFEDWMSLDRSKPPVDLRPNPDKSKPPIPEGWGKSYDVFLQRRVFVPALGAYQWIYVDKWLIDSYLATEGSEQYFGRALSARHLDWHVVYQTPIPDKSFPGGGSLGTVNGIPSSLFPEHYFSFFLPNPLYPRARFITVGDIPRILTLGHGTEPNSTIGQQLGTKVKSEEYLVRLDLQNPYHRNVFQYLTVFDPVSDYIDNDADGLGIDLNSDGFLDITEIDIDEVKIPGRININTAPWYVLAQLPWMTNDIAQAIIAYRDKLGIPVDFSGLNGRFTATGVTGIREQHGFASIGELNCVFTGLANYSIGQYAVDTIDLPGFPDLTTDGPGLGDGIEDDFEERDVIFSRISNLVSVRSDVFTAYILVRIGADGPQKRVVAILDRSGVSKTNVSSPDGKVRIVALHYVPDPR